MDLECGYRSKLHPLIRFTNKADFKKNLHLADSFVIFAG